MSSCGAFVVRPRTACWAIGAVLVSFSLLACGRGEKVETISIEASSTWRIAGPFQVKGLTGLEDGLDRDYLTEKGGTGGSEAGAAASPFRADGKEGVVWKEASDGRREADGYNGIDFQAEFGPVTDVVAYAYRDIESSEDRRVELKVGSDDGIKIWINGEIVLTNHVRRALQPGDDAVIVTLRSGINKLLVKVEQAAGEWGFMLRMDPLKEGEAEGVAIKALTAYADNHVNPVGSGIAGTLQTTPARCPEGEARIELVDLSGEVRASTVARFGGRFLIQAPEGLSGPVVLRAVGLGVFSKAASPTERIILGDGRTIVETATTKARAAASKSRGDESATLEFLALSVEGNLPTALGGYNKAASALVQIDAMTSGKKALGGFPEGLWRYAYRSSLDLSIQPYSLCLPSPYDPLKRYGLVVTLHGATGNDFDQASALVSDGAPSDLIIVAPFGRGDLSYVGAGERDVLDVIDLVCSRYSVDPDRIYLTGSSMGGFGSWRLAQLYPWRFAAVAPFAGWTGTDLLENLALLPVFAVHGDQDSVVPYQSDASAISFLASKGADAKLDLLSGVGHSAFAAWTKDSGPGRLLDWFRPLRRVAWPKSLMMRTTMSRTGKAAWASILGLQDNRKTAGLDARIVDDRHISVETENVSAFALDLRHPDLAAGGRVLILADGFNLTADSGKADARFELGPAGRFRAVTGNDVGLAANTGEGIAAVFEGPLQVIYGTRRHASAKNESIARALAASFDGLLSVEVLSDTEAARRDATPADDAKEAAKIGAGSAAGGDNYSRVFVGNPDECPPLARLLPSLPLVWNKGIFRLKSGSEGGGEVEAGGIILIHPDPERPGHLLALLSLPMHVEGAKGLVSSLSSPLQTGRINDPCGYKLPDAMFIDGGGILWYGFFDWRWSKLEGFKAR